MKKLTTLFLSFAVMAGTAFAGNGDDKGTDYKVNTEKSKIFWTGKKVTGQHTGTIMLKGGSVTLDNGVPTSVSIDIDMTTITVTDIKDEETNGKLKGHLHSEDFFATEKYPTAHFEAKSFKAIKDTKDREPNYTVKGTLTIKGKSQEIEFPAFITEVNGNIVSTGKITFDRTKHDVKYGSGSFFEDLGDNTISDEIEMNFVLSAAK